jgi:hypothetical protein
MKVTIQAMKRILVVLFLALCLLSMAAADSQVVQEPDNP